jgi:HAD superfamily hydrolase (TIGR01509 family)
MTRFCESAWVASLYLLVYPSGMLKAVFFDLNGVLVTSEHLSSRFEAVYGVPSAMFVAALKTVMAVARKPDSPSVYSLFAPFFTEWQLTITESDFLQFWFSGEHVNVEALSCVAELRKRGVAVFVVSNNFRERTEYYRQYFDEVFAHVSNAYFSWETGFVKPSKEALQYVLEENNLNPVEVVYFDDSAPNVEVAKSLGVDGQLWVDLQTAKGYLATLK